MRDILFLNIRHQVLCSTHAQIRVFPPLYSGDTCGTETRHLSGAAPQSGSYVAPFLCDRLEVKISLPYVYPYFPSL
jgi:hypothetical protein